LHTRTTAKGAVERSRMDSKPVKVRTWEDVASRMRNATNQCQGVSAVTITVLVEQGRPLAWFSPVVRHIEPKGDASAFCDWVLLDST